MADAPFIVQYAEEAVRDVAALRPFDQRKVMKAIENFLLHAPTQVSRSRIKRMMQPFWSQFRLRVDDLRVYYDVDATHRTVHVLRVLQKGTAETPKEPPDETSRADA